MKGERLADLNDPHYKPSLPAGFKATGSAYRGAFKVCISAAGSVSGASVIRSTGAPEVDAHWITIIQTWPHRPYSLDGRPIPYCYPLNLEMKVDGREAPAPRMISPEVAARLRTADVTSDARYKPRLPADYQRAGTVVSGVYRVCVDQQGRVTDVSSLKPADREGRVDGAWKQVITTWPHLPYVVGGVPHPYCYPVRVDVAVQ